jgi:octaprenyl-diphosphate synthase
MADYGRNLGIAFQLIDDALDYGPNNAELGKNVGDDLDEGKPTLPVLRAMEVSTPAQRQLLRDAIAQGGRERIDQVIAAIASTDAIAYTTQLARDYVRQAKEALAVLEPSDASDALATLADFAVSRSY